MKFKQHLVLIVLLSTVFGVSSARALDFSAFGAYTVTNYNFTPSTSSASGNAFGLGATVGMDWVPFLSLETGALFLTHVYSPGGVSASTVSSNYLDIPLLLRLSPINFFSLNAGPYYGFAMSSTGSSVSNDYGLLMGLSLRVPLLPLLKARADAMYEYGLANISPVASSTQNSRNFIFLAGVMLDLW